MSENKATKDAKDLKIEEEKELEIEADISEALQGEITAPAASPAVAPVAHSVAAPFGGGQRGKGPRRGGDRKQENKDGFEEKVIAVDRVTRVVKGGRRMRFRALVIVGDKNGKVGYGTGKGNEVAVAVSKAVRKAKRGLLTVNIANGTIIHDITGTSRSTKVLLKSAKKGRGIIAGGAVRSVLELAGYSDIVSKSYGSNNKTNCVIATFNALESLLVRKYQQKFKAKNLAQEPKEKEVEKITKTN